MKITFEIKTTCSRPFHITVSEETPMFELRNIIVTEVEYYTIMMRDDVVDIFIPYENNCVSCHMINLAGAENWRGLDEDGHRKAPPLNGTGHTWHHDDKTLHAIIKYGLAKLVNNYEGKMIGFGDKLSDKEIDSVLAYIKSFWSKENYEYQLKLN